MMKVFKPLVDSIRCEEVLSGRYAKIEGKSNGDPRL
jgi:hypothetical protein